MSSSESEFHDDYGGGEEDFYEFDHSDEYDSEEDNSEHKQQERDWKIISCNSEGNELNVWNSVVYCVDYLSSEVSPDTVKIVMLLQSISWLIKNHFIGSYGCIFQIVMTRLLPKCKKIPSKPDINLRNILKNVHYEILQYEMILLLKNSTLKSTDDFITISDDDKVVRNSSPEHAQFLKEPEGTMGSVTSVIVGTSKVEQFKNIFNNNGKMEKFGRLSLSLPLSWYPTPDSNDEKA